jgi:hypothetical protein
VAKSLEQLDAEKSVDLKDPALAAFLAWLVPGLGHLYQGRTAKAALFFVCILGTFVYGLSLGSSDAMGWGRVVYCSWRPGDKRLQYFCQVGVGLAAMPAVVQTMRDRDGEGPFGGNNFMYPPPLTGDREGGDGFNVFDQGQPTLDTLHYHLARFWELGTVFTMIAGLLNVLAIYDAWDGPVFLETIDDDEDEDEGDAEKQDAEKQDAETV